MKILSLYPADISIGDALLIALISVVLVFVVLLVIILITGGFSKAMNAIDAKTNIMPRAENKILDEDQDAVVALLVATIEFENETHKDSNLISIKRID